MPEDVSPLPWRSHWPALVLALVGGAVALWAKAVLFPELSWNRDEPVYLWQMEVLRDGRLAAPDGGFPRLFLPWLSAARDGEMFGQYTPGWPLALLLARWTVGTATAALPVAAAMCASGTYALAYELRRSRALAGLAGGLMIASPIFALQSGVFLAYVFTLGLGLWTAVLVLSGVRRSSRIRLVSGGVLLGWIFLTRPFDAVVWGGVIGGYTLVVERHRWRHALVHLVELAAGALPFLLAGLLYNRRLTGTPLEFPMTVKDPLDTFGFGTRRLAPDFAPVDYGVRSAIRSSAKNAFVFPWFLAGSYVALVVAIGAVVRWWRSSATWLLVSIGVAFPIAYVPFWGTYLSSLASRISGPIYLVPLYAPVCILVAMVVTHWWRTRPRWALGLVLALVAATVPVAWDRLALNREISRSQAPWQDSLDVVEDPSIVLVADSTYVLYANPFGANRPDLTGPRLFAVPNGPEVLELIAQHPDRNVYLQAATTAAPELGPREDPTSFDVVVRPAEVIRGSSIALTPRLTAPDGVEAVHVEVSSGRDTSTWTASAGEPLPEIQLGEGGLALATEGEVTLTISWGSTTTPPLRATWYYRTSGEEVEVLVPELWQRWEPIDATTSEWRHAIDPAGISVDVSANG